MRRGTPEKSSYFDQPLNDFYNIAVGYLSLARGVKFYRTSGNGYVFSTNLMEQRLFMDRDFISGLNRATKNDSVSSQDESGEVRINLRSSDATTESIAKIYLDACGLHEVK